MDPQQWGAWLSSRLRLIVKTLHRQRPQIPNGDAAIKEDYRDSVLNYLLLFPYVSFFSHSYASWVINSYNTRAPRSILIKSRTGSKSVSKDLTDGWIGTSGPEQVAGVPPSVRKSCVLSATCEKRSLEG